MGPEEEAVREERIGCVFGRGRNQARHGKLRLVLITGRRSARCSQPQGQTVRFAALPTGRASEAEWIAVQNLKVQVVHDTL